MAPVDTVILEIGSQDRGQGQRITFDINATTYTFDKLPAHAFEILKQRELIWRKYATGNATAREQDFIRSYPTGRFARDALGPTSAVMEAAGVPLSTRIAVARSLVAWQWRSITSAQETFNSLIPSRPNV